MDIGAGLPMDACQDVWDWEVLPDQRSFSIGHGSKNLDGDQETMEPVTMPPSVDADVHDEPVDEYKDIGVVPDETKPSTEEPMSNMRTDLLASDGEEKEKTFQSPDAKEADDGKFVEEEENIIKKGSKARPECVVFSVGKLKVNGIGALCSFGVAAATVCIFLIGGRLQHHHRQQQQQQQKIQLQFYGDDKRIQQVVQRIQQVCDGRRRFNKGEHFIRWLLRWVLIDWSEYEIKCKLPW